MRILHHSSAKTRIIGSQLPFNDTAQSMPTSVISCSSSFCISLHFCLPDGIPNSPFSHPSPACTGPPRHPPQPATPSPHLPSRFHSSTSSLRGIMSSRKAVSRALTDAIYSSSTPTSPAPASCSPPGNCRARRNSNSLTRTSSRAARSRVRTVGPFAKVLQGFG